MPAIASSRRKATLLLAPSVTILMLWTFVPLAATLYFSTLRWNLMNPARRGFAGLNNYTYLLTDPSFWSAIQNTLVLVAAVLAITVVFGTLIAILLDQPFPGRGIVRVLIIAPFFVMPTVSALVWKNMMLHPVSGVLTWVAKSVGLEPIDWLSQAPLAAIIIIVAWQWLPFAVLILLTALQSLDHEQREAARIDGAGPIAMFFYIVLPHMLHAIGVVIMVQTIFLLSIFAEILVTTNGGPGTASTNLTYLVYRNGLQQFNVGNASAGGVVAVILANIVAFFLVRALARTLKKGS